MRAVTLVSLLLVVACSQPGKDQVQPPPKSLDDSAPVARDSADSTKPMPSESYLDLILDKNYGSWSGLPAGTALESLSPRIELGKAQRDAVLGSERVKARYVQARAKGYPELLKVWLREDAVTAIEIELPQLEEPQKLLEALGQPGLELDSQIPTTGSKLAKGLRVYPERGLAARLSTDGKNITALWLFQPTTADSYQKTLAPVADFREEPE